MKALCDVCIDIGGSGVKISVQTSSSQLTQPVFFPGTSIFGIKSQCGIKMAEAIMRVTMHFHPQTIISSVVICTTGDIDHKKNILLLSHRLDELETTSNKYGKFDLANQVRNSLKNLIGMNPAVVLVHDSIAACMDPLLTDNLVLAMTLGTYPVLGLAQKSKGSTKIYDTFISTWVDEIILSTNANITTALWDASLKKNDSLTNSTLLVEAVTKVIQKYKAVFKWQPQCFVILGGNANCLKHQKSWPKQISHIKIVVRLSHDESIKTQMRGALNYSKKPDHFVIN